MKTSDPVGISSNVTRSPHPFIRVVQPAIELFSVDRYRQADVLDHAGSSGRVNGDGQGCTFDKRQLPRQFQDALLIDGLDLQTVHVDALHNSRFIASATFED